MPNVVANAGKFKATVSVTPSRPWREWWLTATLCEPGGKRRIFLSSTQIMVDFGHFIILTYNGNDI